MSELTTKSRNALKSSTFGLPEERAYPIPDRAHAINAKARASQQLAKGNLSESQKSRIDDKANAVLAHHRPSHPHAHHATKANHAHHASGK